MTITNFRMPEKRKNKIEQELDDRRMDELLRREYLENARALEAEAMAIELNMPESQLEDDAQVILDQMLAMIHADPELDAIAKAPVGAPMAEASDVEELIRLGRALKESGKTLEDVIGEAPCVPDAKSSARNRTRRARVWAGVAASFVIVCTVSMNSSAMRQFFIERLGWQMGSNPATTIDTESELHFSEDREFSEMEALEVIKNDLGIAPMYFKEYPKEMRFDDVHVETEMQWAKLFYVYNGMIITVIMDKSDEDMSFAVSYDGEKIEEQMVELPLFATHAKVEKIQRDETHTAFYAEIEYGNAFYTVKGDMEEEVFLELIRNITFG